MESGNRYSGSGGSGRSNRGNGNSRFGSNRFNSNRSNSNGYNGNRSNGNSVNGNRKADRPPRSRGSSDTLLNQIVTFRIDSHVKSRWRFVPYAQGKTFPVLLGDVPDELHVGDQFNTIIAKRKQSSIEGKTHKTPHRTFQLRENGYIGHMIYDDSMNVSNTKTLDRKYVRQNLVYRVEVVQAPSSFDVFKFRPLSFISRTDSLINCHYQAKDD
ncbi:hypothetical protein GOV14_06365 [Candidatus Pacearchaeota archaeon]|nr:hypothetical protein [Candidatus Pacearchaeota archaeon]